MTSITPVIMYGGSGTRSSPLSRRLEPKQFQKLVGNRSLFQETLLRFGGPDFASPIVLVNEAHKPRLEREIEENVLSKGAARIIDVRRSYIRAGRRLVSVVRLSNVVIVDTDDALLVASRATSEDVKLVAQPLALNGHPAADAHISRKVAGGACRTVESDRSANAASSMTAANSYSLADGVEATIHNHQDKPVQILLTTVFTAELGLIERQVNQKRNG